MEEGHMLIRYSREQSRNRYAWRPLPINSANDVDERGGSVQRSRLYNKSSHARG